MEPPSSRGPASSGPAGRPARIADPSGAARPGDPAVLVTDRLWRRLAPRATTLVLRAARLGGGAGSVLLTDDGTVRRLNARHRGRNKPTNVLTFPPAPGQQGGSPQGGGQQGASQQGGDIVLALGTVRREAAAARRRLSHHLAHLVLHGTLHLRGHDHHGAGEARRMELQEARLLHRLGVPNPWRR